MPHWRHHPAATDDTSRKSKLISKSRNWINSDQLLGLDELGIAITITAESPALVSDYYLIEFNGGNSDDSIELSARGN